MGGEMRVDTTLIHTLVGPLQTPKNVSRWKQGEDGDRYILKTSLVSLPKAKPESKSNFMFSFLPFDLIINS